MVLSVARLSFVNQIWSQNRCLLVLLFSLFTVKCRCVGLIKALMIGATVYSVMILEMRPSQRPQTVNICPISSRAIKQTTTLLNPLMVGTINLLPTAQQKASTCDEKDRSSFPLSYSFLKHISSQRRAVGEEWKSQRCDASNWLRNANLHRIVLKTDHKSPLQFLMIALSVLNHSSLLPLFTPKFMIMSVNLYLYR